MEEGRFLFSQHIFCLFLIPKYLFQFWNVTPIPFFVLDLPVHYWPSHTHRLTEAERGGQGIRAMGRGLRVEINLILPSQLSPGNCCPSALHWAFRVVGGRWGESQREHGINTQSAGSFVGAK